MSQLAKSNVVETNKPSQYQMIIEKAMSSSSDIDLGKMTQLMDMQTKWEEREAKKSFNKAMSAFKAECPSFLKTSKGHNYMYADLGKIIEGVTPVLSKHGLFQSYDVSQDIKDDGQMVITVSCEITHKDGHSESVPLSSFPDDGGKMNSIQRIASATTYLRRQTLVLILGLSVIDIDDDGVNAVSETGTVTEEQILNIQAVFDETKIKKEPVLNWLKVTSIDEIPAKRYAEVINNIRAKANG